MQRQERRRVHNIFILFHPNLGLCLVLTLQDEISLTQLVTVGPITTIFQQLDSTPIRLPTQLNQTNNTPRFQPCQPLLDLQQQSFSVFQTSQTQIFTLQRVFTQENTISHLYLVSITNYKLNLEIGHSQQIGLKQKMHISHSEIKHEFLSLECFNLTSRCSSINL